MPYVKTDDVTDARTTALELEAQLHVARHAVERAYSAYDKADEHGPVELIVELGAEMNAADEAYITALDALAQHLVAVGAVKALEDAGCYMVWAGADCLARPVTPDHWCNRCRDLAAWRKRLAGEEP